MKMDTAALYTISYGLFIIGAAQGGKRNGMVNNTLVQVTSAPPRLAIALNKDGLTHDMLAATGVFSASVLCQGVSFELFRHFGFRSGRGCDKFDGAFPWALDGQGLPYLTDMACARFSCRVVQTVDLGTHSWFLADILEMERLSKNLPVTYAEYHKSIKPQPGARSEEPPRRGRSEEPSRRGWRCKICGYIHEGGSLPADFTCPICKHGAIDFEEM